MEKNVGTLDMVMRLVISAGLMYIGFFDNPVVSGGISKTIIKIFAFVPLLTAVFRFCPLYTVVGLNTMCSCDSTEETK